MTCAKVCTNPGRSFEMIVRTISTGITNSYCNWLSSTSIRKAYTVLVTFNTVRMELPSLSNPVCLHCSVDARRQISRAIRRDPVGYAAPLESFGEFQFFPTKPTLILVSGIVRALLAGNAGLAVIRVSTRVIAATRALWLARPD